MIADVSVVIIHMTILLAYEHVNLTYRIFHYLDKIMETVLMT